MPGELSGVRVCVLELAEPPLPLDASSIACFSISSCLIKRSVNHVRNPIGRLYASENDQPPEYFRKKNCSYTLSIYSSVRPKKVRVKRDLHVLLVATLTALKMLC